MLPLLLLYEAGIAADHDPEASRTGIDAWLGAVLDESWDAPPWATSAGIAAVCLGWGFAERPRRGIRLRSIGGMVIESGLYGLALLGGFLVFDRFLASEAERIVLEVASAGDPESGLNWFGMVGAGVFEEFLFRLVLLTGVFGLCTALRVPTIAARTLAIAGTSLAFSLVHHLGEPLGEFSGALFVFRWLAGVYFSWVFLLRGFGIAVGTHVAYDLFVGLYPWDA